MIRIGTRGSALALVQARWVAGQLETQGHKTDIVIIKTKGDVVQDRFDKMEGKGFFTKEIEDALRTRQIDLAVHCLKDLPTQSHDDLSIRAILKRDSPLDVLITKPALMQAITDLPNLSHRRIGTSSMRRMSSIQSLVPDALFEPLRGNLPRRIDRVRSGHVDAIVLAQAGIDRLEPNLDDLVQIPLSPQEMVPAPGQGALAIQTRTELPVDLRFVHHALTASCTQAERGILAFLEGGCQLPLGVYVDQGESESFDLFLFLGFPDESRTPLRLHLQGATPQGLQESAQDRLKDFLKNQPSSSSEVPQP